MLKSPLCVWKFLLQIWHSMICFLGSLCSLLAITKSHLLSQGLNESTANQDLQSILTISWNTFFLIFKIFVNQFLLPTAVLKLLLSNSLHNKLHRKKHFICSVCFFYMRLNEKNWKWSEGSMIKKMHAMHVLPTSVVCSGHFFYMPCQHIPPYGCKFTSVDISRNSRTNYKSNMQWQPTIHDI